MEQKILGNKDVFPTPEVVFSHICQAMPLWDMLFNRIHSEYPQLQEEWKFYNDWKCYLLKVTYKKKTVFWLSVLEGTFMVTFYGNDRAEGAILESSLPNELKEQFINAHRSGRIRGLNITFQGEKEVENVLQLIKIKLSVK